MSSSSSKRGGEKAQLPRDVIFKADEEEEIIKWVEQNKDCEKDDVQTTTGMKPLSSVEPAAKRMRLSLSAGGISSQLNPFAAGATSSRMSSSDGVLSSSSRSRLREISNEYSTREPVNLNAQMELYKSNKEKHKEYTNTTGYKYQYQLLMLKSEMSSNFRVFGTSPGSRWSVVMPLAQAPSVLQYSAIPHKEMLFFFDSVENETHLKIPDNALKEGDAAVVKMLVENPLMLCLNDVMLTFLLDLPTALNPFDYLKKNQPAKENAIMMALFKNKRDECKQTQNYLLLDPRCFDGDKRDETSFFDFLRSIFYIGRGTEDRVFDHMRKVIRIHGGIKEIMHTFGESYKKGRVHDIFGAKRGVVILSLFQYVSELEAVWREHCMILARHDYAWSRLGKNPNWPYIILGPLSLTNKDEGETGKFKNEPELNNIPLNKLLGCRMLLHAFGQFKHAPLEEQYASNFKRDNKVYNNASKAIPASPLAQQNIQRFFSAQQTPSNSSPAATDGEEEP